MVSIKSNIQAPDSERGTIEQLNIRENEAFHIVNDENSQLIWIEEDPNGKALQYEIFGNGLQREFLLSIVDSMV